ncbi:MAG: hypothetical protein QM771_02390 [Nitrospira sp.]
MIHHPTYNERSWAIDLIGYIKGQVAQNNRSIKDAGGEQTIRADGGSLFPDVLLFGDRETARILQGWELKMPDTGIDDYEFRSNARQRPGPLALIVSFCGMYLMHTFMFATQILTTTLVHGNGMTLLI